MKKNLILLVLFIAFSSCKESKRNIKTADKNQSIFNIKNFISSNPGQHYSISVTFDEIINHFPSYSLKDIIKKSPKNSTGIRVYYGLDKNKKLHNYLLYTSVETNPLYSDIEIQNKIYEVMGDFEFFKHPFDHGHSITNHHTCPSRCPRSSIADINI